MLRNYLVAVHQNGVKLSRLITATTHDDRTPDVFFEASKASMDPGTLRLIRFVDGIRQLPGLMFYPVTAPISAVFLLLSGPSEFNNE